MVRTKRVAFWLPTLLPLLLQVWTTNAGLSPRRAVNGAQSVQQKSGTVVPGAYFVLFKNTSNGKASSGKSRTESVDDTFHTAFEQFLHQNNADFTPRVKFTNPDLISGMSVKMHGMSHGDAHSLLNSFEGAQAVFPVHYLGNDAIKSFSTPLAARDGDNAPVNINPIPIGPLKSFAPHTLAGMDKVHASGNYGKGVVIGVIDTGVDYTHHALNGGKPDGTPCLGDGCPIVGGASFYDQNNQPNINSDPFPYCNGTEYLHGTHVTGIIMANDTVRGFTGGAPQADLRMYRALDCDGGGSDDTMVAAFQRAFFDNVDVVSASFSFASGWRGDPIGLVITKMIEAGVAVVTSAGNVGNAGAFYAKSPAQTDGVHASAATFNPDLLGFTATATASSGKQPFVYLAANPIVLQTNQLPVYVLKANGTDPIDACSGLPDGTPDLAGKAVLLDAGTCDISDAIANLNAQNATVALFIQNSNLFSLYNDGVQNDPLKVATAPLEAVKWIVDADNVKSGDVSIDLSNPQLSSIQDPNGGHVTDYSEYGPDWDLNRYVGTAAVGGNVLSTFPLSLGGYGIISGTSMSTPLTAAALALYKSAKGKKESPRELLSIFSTTAEPLGYNGTLDVLDSVTHQGGGRLDVAKAIASTTRVFPDFHALNDTEYFNGTQTFTITNVGSAPQKLTIEHLPAGTLYACNGSDAMILLQGPIVPVNEAQATVSYSPSEASVAPGESTTVTVTYQAPNVDMKKCALYSGYTHIKSDDDNGSLTVPYLGFASQMRRFPVIFHYDDGSLKLPDLQDPNTNVTVKDGTVFNLNGTLGQPVVEWGLGVGSRLTTFNLVYANMTDSAAAARRHLAHKRGFKRGANSHTVSADAIYATIQMYTNVPRISNQQATLSIEPTWTDDQNQTYAIADGEYRVLMRALKLRGNPHNEDDFESYLSPKFTVKRT
ncbi:hypothetical protein OC835_004951 [Tilletia horrida]|nr:hypothetical protein OC835_004951 [Tilletia horrida]